MKLGTRKRQKFIRKKYRDSVKTRSEIQRFDREATMSPSVVIYGNSCHQPL